MASTLPRIIYGTAWKEEATTGLVVTAVLQGFRAIDTACQPKHYREDLVGEALKILQDEHGIKREELWLQTKFTSVSGQDTAKTLPYDPNESVRAQVNTSFATSLRQLRTTYLDSYILHGPLSTQTDTLEAWRALGALQDEGKARLIGVSNVYDVPLLKALGKERPVQVVQNRWCEKNKWDREVCAYCRREGILYQSFWTLSGSPGLLKNPAVLAVAKELDKTPAQIVFRVAQVNGVVPLSGTKNKDKMRDAVETEKIDLSSSALQQEITQLSSVLVE